MEAAAAVVFLQNQNAHRSTFLLILLKKRTTINKFPQLDLQDRPVWLCMAFCKGHLPLNKRPRKLGHNKTKTDNSNRPILYHPKLSAQGGKAPNESGPPTPIIYQENASPTVHLGGTFSQWRFPPLPYELKLTKPPTSLTQHLALSRCSSGCPPPSVFTVNASLTAFSFHRLLLP